MNNTKLKQWLRENSSGCYRNSVLAADVIQELEDKIYRWKELLGRGHKETVEKEMAKFIE